MTHCEIGLRKYIQSVNELLLIMTKMFQRSFGCYADPS